MFALIIENFPEHNFKENAKLQEEFILRMYASSKTPSESHWGAWAAQFEKYS